MLLAALFTHVMPLAISVIETLGVAVELRLGRNVDVVFVVHLDNLNQDPARAVPSGQFAAITLLVGIVIVRPPDPDGVVLTVRMLELIVFFKGHLVSFP